MATCCRQLCPRITSCSGWPVLGHGERNALSSPLTFRSLYFLFHSARGLAGKDGGVGRKRGSSMRSLRDRRGWVTGGFRLNKSTRHTLQSQHGRDANLSSPLHTFYKGIHTETVHYILLLMLRHEASLFTPASGFTTKLFPSCKNYFHLN